VQIKAENIALLCRDLRVRTALWLAAGIFVLFGGVFVVVLTLFNIFDPAWAPNNTAPPDPVATACCGLFAGVFPAIGGIAAIVLSVREVRRAQALETLLGLFPNGATFDLTQLIPKLGEGRARRAYVDALSRGGLIDPSAPVPSVAPPAMHSPSPAMPGGAMHSPGGAMPALVSNAPPAQPIQPLVFPPAPPVGVPYPAGMNSPRAATPHMVSFEPQPPTHPSARPDPLAMTSPSAFPSTQPTPAQAPIAHSPRAAAPGPGQSSGDITGRTLKGTWFIEKRLAAGGMGAVYAARHLRTGRRYAVKTMLPDERVSMESLHRFEREAKAASAIGHAGIIAVHDFDRTDDGVHFIVMDLLEGETLEHRLARLGRLAWPDARKVALEVSEALAAAHQAGILHRDLKPSNVFMSQRPGRPERAVLVDFGLAKPIREGGSVWVTRTGAIVGTAHYMSPEQARGERVDERADVYGLGALIYEMIAGVPPFLGSTAFAVLTLLLTEQPVAPSGLVPGIPPRLDALVLRALAKGPNERPESVASFAAELAQIGDA
jgi:tRNA A-37 threonylcarbamoyl transferase component Bud32